MSHRPATLTALVASLLLLVAACGSDTTEATDTSTAVTAAAADAASDTTGEGGAGDDAAAGDATDDEAAADDLSIPATPIEDVVGGFGLEPTPELISCLDDRGVSGDLSTDADIALVTASLMGCAPEDMAAFMAGGLTVPGLEPAQVQCVVTETARAVGALSAPEAATAFESETIPEGLQATVVENAVPACGLTADQVQAVLAAQ